MCVLVLEPGGERVKGKMQQVHNFFLSVKAATASLCALMVAVASGGAVLLERSASGDDPD